MVVFWTDPGESRWSKANGQTFYSDYNIMLGSRWVPHDQGPSIYDIIAHMDIIDSVHGPRAHVVINYPLGIYDGDILLGSNFQL